MLYEAAGVSLSGFIIIANILTIIAFCLRPILRKNPSYWYFTSLAFADFLVGIMSVPATMYAELSSQKPTDAACDIILSMHLFAIVPTFTHLLTISLDRYFKLISPFKYMSIMTLNKAYILVACMWIISLLNLVIFIVPTHSFGETCLVINFSHSQITPYLIWLFLILFQYIPFCFLFFCCLRVYVIATGFKQAVEQQMRKPDSSYNVQLRYHMGRIVSEFHSSSSQGQRVSDHPPVILCHSTDSKMVKSQRLYEWMSTAVKQRKVAILIFCIVTSSGVCWFGASTVYVLSWFCSTCGVRGTWLQYIHPWLLYLNSAVNPILLFLMSDDFRKGLRYIRFCFCSCQTAAKR